MLLQADLGGRQQTLGDRQQSGSPVAMATAIDGNGFQANIDRHQVAAGSNATLAQQRRGQQPAKPRRVLRNRQFVLGIDGDDRRQGRR